MCVMKLPTTDCVSSVSLCSVNLYASNAESSRSSGRHFSLILCLFISFYVVAVGFFHSVCALVHAVLLSFHRRHFSNGLRLHGDLVTRHKCAQHALELQTNGIHAKRNVIVAKAKHIELEGGETQNQRALAMTTINTTVECKRANVTTLWHARARAHALTKRPPLEEEKQKN